MVVLQVWEWLFAPHSHSVHDYCSSGTNSSLVWDGQSPGHREITTQELIIQEGHVLQFKVHLCLTSLMQAIVVPWLLLLLLCCTVLVVVDSAQESQC